MKSISVISKFASIVFATLILAACSNYKTTEEDAEIASAAADAAAAAAAEAAASREAQARIIAEQRRLENTAVAAGTVFYFTFDSSTLTEEARTAVDAHIAFLMTNDKNIRLNGHTDERGTREYNLALGERRANSVRSYMVANGIRNDRIETVSYGEESPVAFGSGEANWSQNRRVELK